MEPLTGGAAYHAACRRVIRWDWHSSVPICLDAERELAATASEGPVCLWQAGFIANRAEVLALSGLPPQAGDAAILLALYQRSASTAAAQIAGPFAWVVWDPRQHTLTAARDRIGTQGLFYTERGASFWLAPQVDALLAGAPGLGRFNLRAVVGQMHAAPPRANETYYEGVCAVEPGGLITVTPGRVQCRRYWHMQPRPTLKLGSDAEYAEACRELLFEVTRGYAASERMGITFSSGMDSTSVAAAIKAVAPAADLTAVTYIAPELPQADESLIASLAAARLGLPHLTVRGDQLWTLSAPEGLHTDRAEPFLLYYEELNDAMNAEFARRAIRVVFDGQSGDDLFGGNIFAYPDLLLTGHWRQLAREFWYHLPRSPVKPSLARAVRAMIIGPILHAYLPSFTRARTQPKSWLRAEHLPLFREISQPDPAPAAGGQLPGPILRLRRLNNLAITQVAEHTNRRARTRQGLELRHPLLDHLLIEFALSLPTTQTFRSGQRKIILRNAMRGRLPDEIVNMWGKTEPSTISERGLREREQARVWALLTDMRAAEWGLVDQARVRQAYQRYLDGQDDEVSLWYTLTLEDWLRRYF